jgi:ABC-type branched-subunit amino acid transport system ATPase component
MAEALATDNKLVLVCVPSISLNKKAHQQLARRINQLVDQNAKNMMQL